MTPAERISFNLWPARHSRRRAVKVFLSQSSGHRGNLLRPESPWSHAGYPAAAITERRDVAAGRTAAGDLAELVSERLLLRDGWSHQQRQGDRNSDGPAYHAAATSRFQSKTNAPPKRGISVEMGSVSRPLNLSSVKDADRQPFVTTGGGVGYLPSGAFPIGALPTGGGGGGGCLTGISAAAAAPSIAKDAASAVRIFSMI